MTGPTHRPRGARATAILDLVDLIRAGEQTTADLCRRLGVSRRTLYRYLAALDASGRRVERRMVGREVRLRLASAGAAD